MADIISSESSALVPKEEGRLDLQQHESGLLQVLKALHLPTEDVLVPVAERTRLFETAPASLSRLPEQHVARSIYLSKFFAAVASGLFDAALNYLWDETVGELRRRVETYNLEFFFDVAMGSQPERRQRLSSADDLSKVDDYELISASQKMGLISEVGYRQLDLVRYMRNHASAAHPNQVELRGIQLVEYLETCIVEVMIFPETPVVAEIKQLLVNVKKNTIGEKEATSIAGFFDGLATEQAADLGKGFFGIYTTTTTDAQTRTNIRLLFPSLWKTLAEDTRNGFGVKYARFIANSDQQQAEWSRELLDVVSAQHYLPEGLRVAELDQALDALLTAHYNYNNFYGEAAPAQNLSKLVGPSPQVPEANRSKYVTTIINVYLGNGYGVSNLAEPIYRELIEAFNTDEALLALESFADSDISSILQFSRPQHRWGSLVELLRLRVAGRRATTLLEALDSYTGPIDRARQDIRIKRVLA